MVKWLLLACACFAGVNWFILPHFPRVVQYVSPLTLWSAIGLSGLLIVGSILLGKK